MQYVPPIQAGSRDEIIAGLLNEAEAISGNGALRLHAKDREIRRIRQQLAECGIELMDGCEEDQGMILATKLPHGDACTDKICRCKPIRRFRGYA